MISNAGFNGFPQRARLVALIDQAFYTGTNFSLTMLLAILAGIESLGHFALIASISALLHSLYVGIVLEPLTVFGSPDSARRIRVAYAHVAALVALVSSALAVGFFGVRGVFNSQYVLDVALGFGLFSGQSIVLCNKRLLLIQGMITGSLWISIRYSVCAFLTCTIVFLLGGYDEYSLVLIIFIASVLASGKWWVASIIERCPLDEIVQVVSAVKKYTTWSVISSFPATVSIHGIYWIAELTSDRGAVGQLKLCEQLIIPLVQIVSTMSMLDQIESAKEFENSDGLSIRRRLNQRWSSYTQLAGVYVILLIGAVLTYDSVVPGVADEFLLVLSVYCLIPFLHAYSIPRNVAAKACRRPDFVAAAYLAMAAVIVVGGMLWRPAEVVEIIGLLVFGWFVHAIVLENRVSSLLMTIQSTRN